MITESNTNEENNEIPEGDAKQIVLTPNLGCLGPPNYNVEDDCIIRQDSIRYGSMSEAVLGCEHCGLKDALETHALVSYDTARVAPLSPLITTALLELARIRSPEISSAVIAGVSGDYFACPPNQQVDGSMLLLTRDSGINEIKIITNGMHMSPALMADLFSIFSGTGKRLKLIFSADEFKRKALNRFDSGERDFVERLQEFGGQLFASRGAISYYSMMAQKVLMAKEMAQQSEKFGFSLEVSANFHIDWKDLLRFSGRDIFGGIKTIEERLFRETGIRYNVSPTAQINIRDSAADEFFRQYQKGSGLNPTSVFTAAYYVSPDLIEEDFMIDPHYSSNTVLLHLAKEFPLSMRGRNELFVGRIPTNGRSYNFIAEPSRYIKDQGIQGLHPEVARELLSDYGFTVPVTEKKTVGFFRDPEDVYRIIEASGFSEDNKVLLHRGYLPKGYLEKPIGMPPFWYRYHRDENIRYWELLTRFVEMTGELYYNLGLGPYLGPFPK